MKEFTFYVWPDAVMWSQLSISLSPAYLWTSIRLWISFSSMDSQNLTDHFTQFTFSAGGLRARHSFLQLI
jgi:hypothetical protein